MILSDTEFATLLPLNGGATRLDNFLNETLQGLNEVTVQGAPDQFGNLSCFGLVGKSLGLGSVGRTCRVTWQRNSDSVLIPFSAIIMSNRFTKNGRPKAEKVIGFNPRSIGTELSAAELLERVRKKVPNTL